MTNCTKRNLKKGKQIYENYESFNLVSEEHINKTYAILKDLFYHA